MAGSLTIRLTQTDEDPARNIAYEPFTNALVSVMGGWHSNAGIKSFFDMTPEDEVGFDAMVGKITSTLDLTERLVRILRITSILSFWEMGNITTYSTPDEIETHLVAIDQGP